MSPTAPSLGTHVYVYISTAMALTHSLCWALEAHTRQAFFRNPSPALNQLQFSVFRPTHSPNPSFPQLCFSPHHATKPIIIQSKVLEHADNAGFLPSSKWQDGDQLLR